MLKRFSKYRKPSHLLLLFAGLMSLVGAINYMFLLHSQSQIIQHEAIKMAEIVVHQALVSRNTYTTQVIDKLKKSDIENMHDFFQRKSEIPIPAEFLRLMGETILKENNGLYGYRFLSKWNIRGNQFLSDNFQTMAWQQLEKQDKKDPVKPIDWQPVWEFETINGIKTLRYIRADPAMNQQCVGCHNALEKTPDIIKFRKLNDVPLGKRWKQHQLLGAIEVDIPLNSVEKIVSKQSNVTLIFVLLTSLFGIAVAGWVAIHDINTLEEAKDVAEKSTLAKSAFLANMSHEIRTPMNAMLGMIQLILYTDMSKEQQNYLLKIQSAAKGLLSILNDILDYSKIEADRLQLEEAEFNLEDLITAISELFAVNISEKELGFFVMIAPDVPRYLIGDSLRLRQILSNLVGNAIKFTSTGEIRVKIDKVKMSEDTVTLRFFVRDTGIGLSKEQSDTLFSAFVQADTSTTRKYGGTGLGLTICKRLVEMMNGEITVSSMLGAGSTFAFTATFRVSKATSIKEETVNVNTQEPSLKLAIPKHDGRVLLVEDNALNQLVGKGLLQHAGYNVTIANHGEEAIECVKNDDYDMIFMDLHMPVMGGLEATRQIRMLEAGKSVPIIAMTAAAMPDEIELCKLAGMNGHVAKPIDPDILFKTLNRFSMEMNNQPAGATQKALVQTALAGVFDIDDLFALLATDNAQRDALVNTIQKLVDEGSTLLNRPKLLLESKEYEEAAQCFHTLRGSIGVLGADRFSAAALAIEKAIKEKRLEELSKLFQNIEAELDVLLGVATQWLEQQKKN
ncbi:MAG: ATP-binding protein [Pseudomonadota bacterium]